MAPPFPSRPAPSASSVAYTTTSQAPSNTASSMNIAGHTNASNANRAWVDFYLGGIYEWTALGAAKVIEVLENLNAHGATYSYDNECGFFAIRCRENDQPLIQSTFRKFQSHVTAEFNPDDKTALGTTLPERQHPFVIPPKSRKLPNATAVQDVQGVQYMKLEVPFELNNYSCISVWQDLQPNDQSFDTLFISEFERNLIEKTSDVTLVFDAAQKVIFIGAVSNQMLNNVKTKLTALLHDYLAGENQVVSHIFFIESNHHRDVGFFSILAAGSQVAQSILLDPWDLSDADYDLCLLRSHKPDTGRQWPSVFGNKKPYYQARIFAGLKLPSRLRSMSQPQNEIAKWLNAIEVGEVASPKLITPQPNGKTLLDIDILDTMGAIIDQEGTVGNFQSSTMTFPPPYEGEDLILLDDLNELALSEASEPALIDQEDNGFIDQPNLQRAMRPSARTILVPKPSMFAQSMAAVPVKEATAPQGEFGRLISAVKDMMRPFQRKPGVISLRFEIGRYLIQSGSGEGGSSSNTRSVTAGRRTNTQSKPKTLDNIRDDLQGHPYLFTKVLTYWGVDVDFVRNMKTPGVEESMWKPITRTTFLDFRFMLEPPEEGEDLAAIEAIPIMVLEVNLEDFSWTVREWDNARGEVYIHCLDHNWDCVAQITHDRNSELNLQYESFAQDLLESLNIASPEIEVQHAFERAPVANQPLPIGITNVRVRQVARLQHQDGKTFLDITRVMSTKTVQRDEKIWKLSYYANDELPGRRAAKPGNLSQWYQASISSVRLEELLRLNEALIPGTEAGWTVEQLDFEETLHDLYHRASDVVSQIDSVGVACDNGHYKQTQQPTSQDRQQGTAKSYYF